MPPHQIRFIGRNPPTDLYTNSESLDALTSALDPLFGDLRNGVELRKDGRRGMSAVWKIKTFQPEKGELGYKALGMGLVKGWKQ